MHLIQLAAPCRADTSAERTLKALERIVQTKAYEEFVREVSMLQKVHFYLKLLS